eukprot:790976-Alexandrium_andersonii.AAC.1
MPALLATASRKHAVVAALRWATCKQCCRRCTDAQRASSPAMFPRCEGPAALRLGGARLGFCATRFI